MRLLIVEDQQKHLEDATATVLRLQKAFELQVRYASTLEAAMEQLDWADAVVTDLFFPEKPGESPTPDSKPDQDGEFDYDAWWSWTERISGIRFAAAAKARGKAVVICTSTRNHSDEVGLANSWLSESGLPEMVDARGPVLGTEAQSKDWTKAILSVIALQQVPVEDWQRFGLVPIGARGEFTLHALLDSRTTNTLRKYASIPKDE